MALIKDNIDEYYDSKFKDIDLSNSTLEDKEFINCIFKHSNFGETIFENCIFTNCTFENSDLSLIKIVKTNFNNIRFTKCKVIGVDWTQKFKYKIVLKFHESVINYSVFNGITLKGFELVDSIANEVDFIESDMKNAVCTGTNFLDSNFLKTNLTGADFRKASNYRINPTTNRVGKAKFSMPDALSLLSEFNIIIEN